MFFNIPATFAEFAADLTRLRTRQGMQIARAKGRLRGKQPKLSDKQQKELGRMHGTGQYTISDLAEPVLYLSADGLPDAPPFSSTVMFLYGLEAHGLSA